MSQESDTWKRPFEQRSMSLESVSAPDDEMEGDWYQALARFARRGFLRVAASPADGAVRLYVQLALPGAEEEHAQKLKSYFKPISKADWTTETGDRPWVLEAKVDSGAPLEATLDALETLASGVERVESGTSVDEVIGELSPREEPPEDGEDDAKADPDRSDTDAKPDESDKSDGGSEGVFETIGDGDDTSTEDGREEVDIALVAFRARVADKRVQVHLEFDGDLDDSGRTRLRKALEHTLRARFDVVLKDFEPSADEEAFQVDLAIEPATLGAAGDASLGELCDGLARFFERIKKFNALGMSPFDVLSRSKASPPKRPEESDGKDRADDTGQARRQSTHGERRQEAHMRPREDQRRAESGTSGVVLAFGGAELDADRDETTLEPGDYTDERLRRPDATTPLVDVVLRHPGYSDKSMRQVLSILLDVDYFEADSLADDAPCIIAWGVSQERAQEFKRVIENAGGRVTLVEPDSL